LSFLKLRLHSSDRSRDNRGQAKSRHAPSVKRVSQPQRIQFRQEVSARLTQCRTDIVPAEQRIEYLLSKCIRKNSGHRTFSPHNRRCIALEKEPHEACGHGWQELSRLTHVEKHDRPPDGKELLLPEIALLDLRAPDVHPGLIRHLTREIEKSLERIARGARLLQLLNLLLERLHAIPAEKVAVPGA
jgi:hypothetical protein